MNARETTFQPQFVVLGGFGGFGVVGAAAMWFIYSAGDPGQHARLVRVGIASLVGAGTGAYLGKTRRQFILHCAALLARPWAAIYRLLGCNRSTLQVALQLLLAALLVAVLAVFVVLPDYRLHRIVDRLQSTDRDVSSAAAYEMRNWSYGGISSLLDERNRTLVRLLDQDRAIVRISAANALCWLDPPVEKAVPRLIELLNDPNQDVRIAAIRTLGSMKAAARPAVPMLVQHLHDPPYVVHWNETTHS